MQSTFFFNVLEKRMTLAVSERLADTVTVTEDVEGMLSFSYI